MHGMKKMNKEKFVDAYNGFIAGGLTLDEAAKIAERSTKTIRKYFGMVLEGTPLPKDLFEEDDKKVKK